MVNNYGPSHFPCANRLECKYTSVCVTAHQDCAGWWPCVMHVCCTELFGIFVLIVEWTAPRELLFPGMECLCVCSWQILNSVVRYFYPAAGSVSKLHVNCRNGLYPRTSIHRFNVSDDCVSWDVTVPEYTPVHYTANVVAKRPFWADADFEYATHVLC